MAWYDFFSRFYDASLEAQYAAQRRAAADALQLAPGLGVLDLPCGTGQSFDAIAPAIPGGTLVGVDVSAGMLRRAQARVQRNEWSHVHTVACDVHNVTLDGLSEAIGKRLVIDRVHVFLGMTAFPRFEDALARVWDLLQPGGRCVIVDVHAAKPGLQGRMVNLIARADIRREFWKPLQRVAEDYTRTELPSTWQHGGAIYLATGRKPG